jgi:adenine-specific DNA methylase
VNGYEKVNIIPTEKYPEVTMDERPRLYGMPTWADMLSPRQLLCMGVLVEELRKLRVEIVNAEATDLGEAISHLLAFGIDTLANYNCYLAFWHAPRQVIRSLFDRHDFSFKVTFTGMAPCGAGVDLDWSIENVIEPYEELAELSQAEHTQVVAISLGSATNLSQLTDGEITPVVVDPPYADNVQYSELADFF